MERQELVYTLSDFFKHYSSDLTDKYFIYSYFLTSLAQSCSNYNYQEILDINIFLKIRDGIECF